jgi:hypothetical protein
MNRTNQSMGIIIVAAIALMLVVGAGLSSMQRSYAHGKSHKETFSPNFINSDDNGNKNKNEKSGPKSQNLNQRSDCQYIIDCRNSNVAVQTSGSSNSVTGFADQSTNSNSNTTSFESIPNMGQLDTGSPR